ncbi:HNH endonuclease [Polaromonas sp.]|uniref:HNH endonuclease n=1 Tax=Polaromonas sp. TaxID=1869339 RepID=UPI00352AEBC4
MPRRQVRFRKCTTEHLVAQRDGGQDTPENIAAACERCNWKRHAGRADRAPSPEEFRKEVQAARLQLTNLSSYWF